MPLTNAVAGISSAVRPDRRISARIVPKMMPPSVETMVSSTENQNPVATNRLMTSQLTQERSMLPMSVPPAAGAGDDEARDAHALFDHGEHAIDREGGQRVQRGDAQVDFDAAR